MENQPLFDTGPIKKWEIRFKFTQNGTEYTHTFYNVSDLSNYLKDLPERGVQIGYGKEIRRPVNMQNYIPVTNCGLSIWYLDLEGEHTVIFSDAHSFAKWLDIHPEVAKCVSYKKSAGKGP